MPLNYDQLTATTRKYYIRSLVDQVYNSIPLLNWLRRNQRPVPGGVKIVQPVRYNENPNRGSFKGFDVLSVQPHQIHTAAEWNWKRLYVTLAISGEEEDQNRGDLAVLNLIEDKMEEARDALRDLMTAQIFSDGTGNQGKDIDGLLVAIDDGTNYVTYAGINRNEFSFWRAQYQDLAGSALTLDHLGAMITRCTDGNDKPDLIVTTPELWDHIEKLLMAKTNWFKPDTGRVADAGFDTLRYRGIDIVYDRACPAGSLFFLNSRHLRLRPHVEYTNFKDTGWKKPINQDAAVMQIFWYGNLTLSQPRRVGRIVNAAAA